VRSPGWLASGLITKDESTDKMKLPLISDGYLEPPQHFTVEWHSLRHTE
jgi:hypothetical protein